MTKSEVFCLTNQDGNLLDPALQATALAKYSRSPDSAKIILQGLDKEKADHFQSKWVVQYGHNSVAELATIPICFENVSIIASKFIESWQRPGFSEKSTRYQKFSSDSFITPPGSSETMKEFCKRFYQAYDDFYEEMFEICSNKMQGESERVIRARVFDNLRYLLPAGTGTNIGMVANLRDIRDMITQLTGHENPEFVDIGNKLRKAAESVCLPLIRHTDPDNFQIPIEDFGQLPSFYNVDEPVPYVDLKPPFNNDFLTHGKQVTADFMSKLSHYYHMTHEEFDKHMEKRPSWSQVPDIFKTIDLEFEIMMDYGAYRDLQRHRRCSQFAERLNSFYGYMVPDDIIGTSLETKYRQVMESVTAYSDESVDGNNDLLQYIVPLGYNHRSIFIMDMKELYYIVELRTKPQGHISYRRIAYMMYEAAKTVYPELMKWCRVVEPNKIEAHR